MSTVDRRAAAHHEAGHAVAAHFVGRGFRFVDIEETETRYGLVAMRGLGEWFRPDIEIDSRTRRFVELDCIVGWSGPLSEERFTGTFNDEGAETDLLSIQRLAIAVADGGVDEASAYIEWLRQRSLSLLCRPLVWESIEAVADALVERGRLSRREVTKTIATTTQLALAPEPGSPFAKVLTDLAEQAEAASKRRLS